MECVQLRNQDLDFGYRQISVGESPGDRFVATAQIDRYVPQRGGSPVRSSVYALLGGGTQPRIARTDWGVSRFAAISRAFGLG